MRRDAPRNNKLLQHHHEEGGETNKQSFHCRSGYHWVAALLPKDSVQENNLSHEKNYSHHPDNPNFIGRGWTKQIVALVLTIHVEE